MQKIQDQLIMILFDRTLSQIHTLITSVLGYFKPCKRPRSVGPPARHFTTPLKPDTNIYICAGVFVTVFISEALIDNTCALFMPL